MYRIQDLSFGLWILDAGFRVHGKGLLAASSDLNVPFAFERARDKGRGVHGLEPRFNGLG